MSADFSTAPATPDLAHAAGPAQASVLHATITGILQLQGRAGEAEAQRAFERCFNRMERAVQSFDGRILKHVGERVTAVFERAEDAWQAAHEMQLKVEKLPAIFGLKLTLSVAVHHGSLSGQTQDSAPAADTLKVAERLARLTKEGQILLSAPTVALLPDKLQQRTHALEAASVRLHGQPIPVFALLWQATRPASSDTMLASESARAVQVSAASSINPVAPGAPATPLLRVCHLGQEFMLNAARPVLTLGRDPQCDLIIRSPHASRHHGRIALRHGLYVFTDHSTNGTQILPLAAPSQHVRHADFVLQGQGCLCFGALGETAERAVASASEAIERISYELV